MQGKKGAKSKSIDLLDDSGENRTIEEEAFHWKKVAIANKEAMDTATENIEVQDQRIDELHKTISKLKDKQIQMQQRYAKELTQQGKALLDLKEQADSADSKAMIKRMVDMARQISDLTQSKKEMESALENQADQHRLLVQELHRKMLEVEAAALSKVEHATKLQEVAQEELAKANEEVQQLRNTRADSEQRYTCNVDELRGQLETRSKQIEELEMATQNTSHQLIEAQQRADVANQERDLALRGLATYRERHPTPTAELEITEREYHSAIDALESARNTLDPMEIELAEAAMKKALDNFENTRSTVLAPSSNIQTAWSQLLKSLPKRTKIKVLTKNAFRKVVHELHQEKVRSSGADKVPEPVFIQEFFHKRYGLEEIADTYLFGFLCSLQKYTPKEMGFDNPGVVYYLNRLRSFSSCVAFSK